MAGTFAWRSYGVHWIQLDAPRHIHIPTEDGMRVLANRANLRIVQSFYDSWSFQFWGSEQYKQDIPLNDPRTPIFSHDTIDEWQRLAVRLNEVRDGDHATFILEHQQPPSKSLSFSS